MLRTLACAFVIASATFGQSITRNKSGGPPGEIRTQPDGLTGTNVTLKQLIRFAYRLHDSQVSGPSWIETARFDITAKVLAPVLADRFRLKFHHESKEIPVYLLVVAKGGPHLRDRQEGQAAFDALVKDGASPFKPTMASLFEGCDLWAFAERASLLTALRDQLGLGLEPQSALQDTMVIDQAERP